MNPSDLDAVNKVIDEASKEPVPRISGSPNCDATLLMGLQDKNGDWHVNAVVREMTGEDEEHLSHLETRDNLSYADYMTELLSRTVVSIGPAESWSPTLIDSLVTADRDILFIATIRATYGDQREFRLKCSKCGGSNDVNVDLVDGFPVLGTTEQIRSKREVTLRSGATVTVSHPTGADSRYVAKHAKTTAEQNTTLIARCCDVSTQVPNKVEWAKKLGIADRNAIIKVLFGDKFGPQIEEVNAPCGHCDENISFTVDWVSLLFG